MGAGVYRKEFGVVVLGRALLLAPRVTHEAGPAVVDVTLNARVFLVHVALGVTAEAGESAEVPGVRVTVRATVPYAAVFSREDREKRIVLRIEGRAPGHRFVAIYADRSEPGGHVPGILGIQVIRLVTVDASSCTPGEVTFHHVGMAVPAIDEVVFTERRKSGVPVYFLRVEDFPSTLCVTSTAFGTYPALVNVLVTAVARRPCRGEIGQVVAARAARLRVGRFEREAGLLVVELDFFPGLGRMTILAYKLLTAVRVLREASPSAL